MAKFKRTNIKIFIKIILLLFVLTIPIFILFKSTEVSSIECKSQFGICNRDLSQKIIEIPSGTLLETYKRISQVLKNNISVKKYSVQLKLNGTFIVYVEERVPVYCMKSGDVYIYSDIEGLIVNAGGNTDFGCVSKEGVFYEKGSFLDEQDLKTLQLSKKLENLPDWKGSWYENGNLVVEQNENIKLIFSLKDDIDLSAGKAYYIVSHFDKIEEYIMGLGEKSVHEIDFRYKNPIIRII